MLQSNPHTTSTPDSGTASGSTRIDRSDIEPINFVDLKAQQALIRDDVERRIKDVLDHGAYINGPEIGKLEKALSQWTGAEDVVLCGNGTEALEIAMMGASVGQGDAVFIPAFTYNATASAVLMVGATPVFVDVYEDTFNMDAADLEIKVEAVALKGELTPKMVVPVDLFGLPADYAAIRKVADAHDLRILADGAQAFGGRQDGRFVGNIADMTATSFFPAKSLGCYGDGGAIFTRSKEEGDVWRSIRWHGTDEARRESVRIGTNGRLDTIQAAVLLSKLSIFDQELKRRAEIAAVYDEILGEVMALPARPENCDHGWGYYSITLDDRDGVRAALQDKSVPTAIYYQQALHTMEAFKAFAPSNGLPVAEKLSERIISLPIHPYMSDDQVLYVAQSVRELVG